jgi:hypothetical protein
LNPCPCCGYLVFERPPGSHDICPICRWDDDALQLEFATTLQGGANLPTLLQAQRYFAEFGSSDPREISDVRPPYAGEQKEPSWRPIDARRDQFETWGLDGALRAPAQDHSLYYWRPAFWRRRRT